MDDRSNRIHRVTVDSGTQAGIHVPVRVFLSIVKVETVDKRGLLVPTP
jgi:hypothetical protein